MKAQSEDELRRLVTEGYDSQFTKEVVVASLPFSVEAEVPGSRLTRPSDRSAGDRRRAPAGLRVQGAGALLSRHLRYNCPRQRSKVSVRLAGRTNEVDHACSLRVSPRSVRQLCAR